MHVNYLNANDNLNLITYANAVYACPYLPASYDIVMASTSCDKIPRHGILDIIVSGFTISLS